MIAWGVGPKPQYTTTLALNNAVIPLAVLLDSLCVRNIFTWSYRRGMWYGYDEKRKCIYVGDYRPSFFQYPKFRAHAVQVNELYRKIEPHGA